MVFIGSLNFFGGGRSNRKVKRNAVAPLLASIAGNTSEQKQTLTDPTKIVASPSKTELKKLISRKHSSAGKDFPKYLIGNGFCLIDVNCTNEYSQPFVAIENKRSSARSRSQKTKTEDSVTVHAPVTEQVSLETINHEEPEVVVLETFNKEDVHKKIFREVPKLSEQLFEVYYSHKTEGTFPQLDTILEDEQLVDLFGMFLHDEKSLFQSGENAEVKYEYGYERLTFYGELELLHDKAPICMKLNKFREVCSKLWFSFLHEESPLFVSPKAFIRYVDVNELLSMFFDEKVSEDEILNCFDSMRLDTYAFLNDISLPKFIEFVSQRLDSVVDGKFVSNLRTEEAVGENEADFEQLQQVSVEEEVKGDVLAVSELPVDNAAVKQPAVEPPVDVPVDDLFLKDFILFFYAEDRIKKEGIFRVPGVKTVADHLTTFINQPVLPSILSKEYRATSGLVLVLEKLLQLGVASVDDICSGFKTYVGDSQHKFLPSDVNDALFDAFHGVQSDETMWEESDAVVYERVVKVLKQFEEKDQQKYENFCLLLSFLKRVALNKQDNKMSSSNLSTCFVNSLLNKKGEDSLKSFGLLKPRIELLNYLIDTKFEFEEYFHFDEVLDAENKKIIRKASLGRLALMTQPLVAV